MKFGVELGAGSPLVLENWDSGTTDVIRQQQALATWSCPGKSSGKSCFVRETCFCNPRRCSGHEALVGARRTSGGPSSSSSQASSQSLSRQRSNPAWYQSSFEHKSPQASAAGSPGSAPVAESLAAAAVPEHLRIRVDVLFGLHNTTDDGNLIDWSFNPASAWAQRAMYSMCSKLDSSLQVVESRCWITGFRSWLLAKGERFPTPRLGNFQQSAKEYVEQASGEERHIWFVGGQLRAFRLQFLTRMRTNAPFQDVLDLKGSWDDYVRERNSEAKQQAQSSGNAWHTSLAWVPAVAEKDAYETAWITFQVSFWVCVFAAVAFTLDAAVAAYVVGLIIVACGLLGFCMFIVLNWSVGPIEVIAMSMFLGYAVEPALRLGQEYFRKPEEDKINEVIIPDPAEPAVVSEVDLADADIEPREAGRSVLARVERSVRIVGPPMIVTSLKTVVSSCFLLPCTLRIFARLGTAMMLVALLSLFCTLVLLPALLLLFGPQDEVPVFIVLAKKSFDFIMSRINSDSRNDPLETTSSLSPPSNRRVDPSGDA